MEPGISGGPGMDSVKRTEDSQVGCQNVQPEKMPEIMAMQPFSQMSRGSLYGDTQKGAAAEDTGSRMEHLENIKSHNSIEKPTEKNLQTPRILVVGMIRATGHHELEGPLVEGGVMCPTAVGTTPCCRAPCCQFCPLTRGNWSQ